LPAHAQISHGLHREMLISSIDIDYWAFTSGAASYLTDKHFWFFSFTPIASFSVSGASFQLFGARSRAAKPSSHLKHRGKRKHLNQMPLKPYHAIASPQSTRLFY
jgi:hypothetical protein